VSGCRPLTREAVDAVGGGRVWTGRQALERGLVDELGGIEAAVRKARELAGLGAKAQLRELKGSKKSTGVKQLQPAAAVTHVIEGAQQLFGGVHPLVLCPFVWEW
jgi:protease-4